MHTHTPIRRWPAIGLAAAFLGGTGYVLFQDVIEGAPVNTGHVLTALAMLASVAAGHYAWPTLRSGRPVLALGLGVLALAGLAYVATMSGARNAEVAAAKVQRASDNATERARITKLRLEAEEMQRTHRNKLAAECASGKGDRCKGVQATLEVYDAAVAGHDARLAKLGPAVPQASGLAAAAQLIVLVPWVTMTVSDVERKLSLVMPWLAVTITELGAIVFLRLSALAGNRCTERKPLPTLETVPPLLPETVAAVPRKRPALPAPFSRQRAETDLVTLLALGKPLPSQDFLAQRWHVPKGTVSKWMGRWETAGLVSRETEGRRKVVAAG